MGACLPGSLSRLLSVGAQRKTTRSASIPGMEAIADHGHACCAQRQGKARAPGLYRRRRPAETVHYQVVQEHLETFLSLADDPTGPGLPGYVERDFRKYLKCGILAYGFARARCKDCGDDYLIGFSAIAPGIALDGWFQTPSTSPVPGIVPPASLQSSCRARGACPSCNTRRMVEIAAHLVDHVIPPVPVRQWVLSLPKRLRGFLQRDATLAGKVLRIMLEEVERELRGHCPEAGAKARTGAVGFSHRFGTSLNGQFLCDAAHKKFHVEGRDM